MGTPSLEISAKLTAAANNRHVEMARLRLHAENRLDGIDAALVERHLRKCPLCEQRRALALECPAPDAAAPQGAVVTLEDAGEFADALAEHLALEPYAFTALPAANIISGGRLALTWKELRDKIEQALAPLLQRPLELAFAPAAQEAAQPPISTYDEGDAFLVDVEQPLRDGGDWSINIKCRYRTTGRRIAVELAGCRQEAEFAPPATTVGHADEYCVAHVRFPEEQAKLIAQAFARGTPRPALHLLD